MKILVTGAAGFVGQYLLDELTEFGHQVIASTLETEVIKTKNGLYPALTCDLTQKDQVSKLITENAPDAVVHLAAFSDLGRSWSVRDKLLDINIFAALNVGQSLASLNKKSVFLYVSTGAVYSNLKKTSLIYADESLVPQPLSPYAYSKLAAEHGLRAIESDTFSLYIARPFNHIGPGQSTNFVCTAFAERIAQAQDGASIPVGNLNVIKDFSDVRDITRAYRLILEQQPEEKLFVLGQGKPMTVQTVFDILSTCSHKNIRSHFDQTLARPEEHGAIVSNPKLAQEILGWSPRFLVNDTLSEIYKNISLKDK
ncbi:MAG: GDP-mannose 4,6-dehydratase [Oligoflexales bacterium]|nr:GDP-mannose 4,6-dehydratase [Oligoflexales bacterium]